MHFYQAGELASGGHGFSVIQPTSEPSDAGNTYVLDEQECHRCSWASKDSNNQPFSHESVEHAKEENSSWSSVHTAECSCKRRALYSHGHERAGESLPILSVRVHMFGQCDSLNRRIHYTFTPFIYKRG